MLPGEWLEVSRFLKRDSKTFQIKKRNSVTRSAQFNLTTIWKSDLNPRDKCKLLASTAENDIGAETWTISTTLEATLVWKWSKLLRSALNIKRNGRSVKHSQRKLVVNVFNLLATASEERMKKYPKSLNGNRSRENGEWPPCKSFVENVVYDTGLEMPPIEN